jgi:type VI secretion system protein ImpE
LFKAGRLHESIDAQIAEVKASPADHGKRLFLFELLAFAGELDRAGRQIDAIQYDELELHAAVTVYRKLLDAERVRRRVFQEGLTPEFLVEPPAHVERRLEALDCLCAKQFAQAERLLAEIASTAPQPHGEVNGRPFQLFRDADDSFGTVLEVMSGTGAYFWVPLEQIDSLELESPRFPRDLLWAPAHLEVRGGPSGDVFLPAVYPGSHEQQDEQIQLGRTTDWRQLEGHLVLGLGGRTFLADDDAFGLLELRTLVVSDF